MAPGKFEDASHSELYNMIATAKPSQLTEVGAALSAAFDDINAIADELKAHAERVNWEGEGADAFRAWGREVAKQTHRMADYTLLVGVHMTAAGQGLTEVKAAMPFPKKCITKDMEDSERKAAEEDRQEALKQMDKLDSYYETAHTELAALEEPNFPPLPPLSTGDGGAETPSGATGAATIGGGGTSTTPTKPFAGAVGSVGGAHATPVSRPSVGADGKIGPDMPDLGAATAPVTGTTIDSATTAPPPPDVIDRTPALPMDVPDQRVTGPGPVGPVGPIGTGPRLPNNVPPALRGGGPPSFKGPVGPPPGVGKQPLAIPPRIGGTDGITGVPRKPQQTAVPRLPQSTVIGEERTYMGRGPMGGGYQPVSGNPPGPGTRGPGRRLSSEPGGVVDRPSGTNPANGQRLPRSTVVGEERGMPVRGPLGPGAHPVVGGPQGPGNNGTGRRLASEPGGVAGGPRGSREGRSDFTPGGSGLVRGGQTPGAMPPRTGTVHSSDRLNAGARPDYLQEDEETWAGGRRSTVPPVIE